METQVIDWAAHMKMYEASGMSIRKYCSAHGLNFKAFKSSRYRYHYNRTSGKRASPTKAAFKEFALGFTIKISSDAEGRISVHDIGLEQLPAVLSALSALSR